jgi:hypothetical protein
MIIIELISEDEWWLRCVNEDIAAGGNRQLHFIFFNQSWVFD